MPDVSPLLSLPLLLPAQAQKHVTHNEALSLLDLLVQLVVEGFGAVTPPATPAEGEVWALGSAPLAAWAGQAQRLATWRAGAWQFVTPRAGWRAWGRGGAELRVFTGTAWVDLIAAASLQNLAGVGIGTAWDATNRLALAGAATLFSHAGAGHQVKINKAGVSNTASLLFQSGFSGRAEIGLAGNDALSVKVSATGSSFATALTADGATGRVSLPSGLDVTGGLALGGQTLDPAGPVEGAVWHNSTTGQIRARIGGAVRALGSRDVPWLLPPAGEHVMTGTGTGGAPTTTAAGTANRMDLFPFIPRGDLVLNGLALNVTTAAAGSLGRGVIYAADASGRPDALILETADLDFASSGVRTATLSSLTLFGGATYWIGVRHSATATISSWPTGASPDLNGGPVSTAARKILRRTLAFATAAPASWGYLSSEISSGLAPAIWLRVA